MKINTPLVPIHGQMTNGMRRKNKTVYKTVEDPYKGKVMYKLGGQANTIVFAKPGADIEALKLKYLSVKP